uniref:Apolipoprotein M n=1 Tax=Salarias fasciatus TaxID=181472 RepID=A0A672GBR0_SALFA
MSPRVFSAVLLALFSLTAASDPECEALTRTLEDRTKILGKWFLYAGTSECEDSLTKLKTIKSSWLELVPIPESDDVTLYYGDKMDGKCYLGSANSTYDGQVTRATFYYNSSSHVHYGKHLALCPDCILWVDSPQGESQGCRNTFLYTKTGDLAEADQVVFKKQLACLNFKLDLFYGDSSELCPYQKVDTIVPSV